MGKESSKGWSKPVIPYNATAVPASKPTCTTSTSIKRPAAQSQAYERTTRAGYEDKQSGSYERYTRKEKASSGELHVEKGTGQVGLKDEFTRRSTIKIGNKRGYTEYHVEENFRDVDFGKSSSSSSRSKGPNKGLTLYDDDNDDDNDDNYESDPGNTYDYNSDDGENDDDYESVSDGNGDENDDYDDGYSDDDY